MSKLISCHMLRELLDSGECSAVLDVREQGEYNERQIAGATSLPRRLIEFCLPDLVPNFHIPLVVYDEGGKRALLATATIREMGFHNVRALEDGLPAWIDAGYPTSRGVNVPSKAFGEKLHVERKVPEITADRLRALREGGVDLILLDARTPAEYSRFCIPGAYNIPGGDLILWAGELRRRLTTTVVVNCAGRTRGIVGTAALRRLGLRNVYALENGTMGWLLAGFELERNPKRRMPAPSQQSLDEAELLARRVAEKEAIPFISIEELQSLKNRPEASFYLIDVRSQGEFESGHIPGSLNVPAGQAVQRADDYIAVKNARIILASNQQARSVMAAYWLRQMGFSTTCVLQGGIKAWRQSGDALEKHVAARKPAGWEEAGKSIRFITAGELSSLLGSARIQILDVGTSLEFEVGHLPGSRWLSRGSLELKIPELFPNQAQPIVITCPNGDHSTLAARTLRRLGHTNVAVLDGGVVAWRGCGYPLETGLEGCLTAPIDVVLSPSIKGDKEAMKRYLEWEIDLGKK